MTEVYRSHDSATVGHLQSLLESEGIKTYFRNEHVAQTAIAIQEFTPALCILDEGDVARGVDVIRAYLESTRDVTSAEITCPKCGESNPGNFAACWSCGAPLEA